MKTYNDMSDAEKLQFKAYYPREKLDGHEGHSTHDALL